MPIDKLNMMLAAESRRFRVQSVSYASSQGLKKLRAQTARRSLTSGRYRNCFRLNAAFWSEQIEQAVETLGGIAETVIA